MRGHLGECNQSRVMVPVSLLSSQFLLFIFTSDDRSITISKTSTEYYVKVNMKEDISECQTIKSHGPDPYELTVFFSFFTSR